MQSLFNRKIDFSVLGQGFRNTDVAHSKIASGLYHCLAIAKDESSKRCLVGWGLNEQNVLGYQQFGDEQFFTEPEKIDLVYKNTYYMPIQVSCGPYHSAILAIPRNIKQLISDLDDEDEERENEKKGNEGYNRIAQKQNKDEQFARNLMNQRSLLQILENAVVFLTGSNQNGRLGINAKQERKINAMQQSQSQRAITIIDHKEDTFQKNQEQVQEMARFQINQAIQIHYEEESKATGTGGQNIINNNMAQTQVPGPQLSQPSYKPLRSTTQGGNLKKSSYRAGTIKMVEQPTALILNYEPMVMIACGHAFTLALTAMGRIYAWGCGESGALGNGLQEDNFIPKQVQFEKGVKCVFIAAGSAHSAAITDKGYLYTWGLGSEGQLGNGYFSNAFVPERVTGELETKLVTHISLGGMHSGCVTKEGYAYTWGVNNNGQLGHKNYEQLNKPKKLTSLENFFCMYIECGINNTMVVTETGQIFGFGNNQNNKLGISDPEQRKIKNFPQPQELDSGYIKQNLEELDQKFVYQIKLGQHFSLGLLENGSLLSWGLYISGTLGRELFHFSGDAEALGQDPALVYYCGDYKSIFEQMQHPEGVHERQQNSISSRIVQAKCGLFHTVALTNAGEVFVWGQNNVGQHGVTTKEIQLSFNKEERKVRLITDKLSFETLPTKVEIFSARQHRVVSSIAAGFEYVIIIENRRAVYSWGKNQEGQLGLGVISECVTTPTRVTMLEGHIMKMVACGETHSLFLTDAGEVYSCGHPQDGKLGLGVRSTLQITPQRIESLLNIVKVSCSQRHSMALGKDTAEMRKIIKRTGGGAANIAKVRQVVYTWGSGWDSKLGFGNKENLYYPAQLQTNYNFKDIACGVRHSAALDDDGTLIVWGPYRSFGMQKPDEEKKKRRRATGEAETYEFQKPVPHPEFQKKGKRFRQVALGDKFNIGICTTGEVIAWGEFDQEFQRQLEELIQKGTNKNLDNFYEATLTNIVTYSNVSNFEFIDCNRNHAVALGRGSCFSWGCDCYSGKNCLW